MRMIEINSQEIRYFYRNIVKSGNVYRIKYNNKDYGEFKKLSDALYERDALFYCNFDYDLLVECDLENKYENTVLPPFPEKRSKGRIKGIKVNKKDTRRGVFLLTNVKCYVKMEDVTPIIKGDTIYEKAFNSDPCSVHGPSACFLRRR